MSREVMKMALDALETFQKISDFTPAQAVHAITALRKELAQPNEFNPNWDSMAVMVEEQQRMAKRIEELEAMLEQKTARLVDLQAHIENLEGEQT